MTEPSSQPGARARRVLMPLPDRDFDTTEVAVPWHVLTRAGYEVVFATEAGAVPRCDPRLLDGVIFGALGAAEDAIALYRALEDDPAFREPARWDALDVDAFDGLFLAGGHAPGMRQYLGSEALQRRIADFWGLGRPVAAICHGPVLLARARSLETGRSVLHGVKTTCLPKYMERSAYLLTFWKLGRYYRTYPRYVADEVRDALDDPRDYQRGPRTLTRRGTETDDRPAFALTDGRYVSGRWPGDSWLVARRFRDLLDASVAGSIGHEGA